MCGILRSEAAARGGGHDQHLVRVPHVLLFRIAHRGENLDLENI
jgi:hypothetical protein